VKSKKNRFTKLLNTPIAFLATFPSEYSVFHVFASKNGANVISSPFSLKYSKYCSNRKRCDGASLCG
jgi:hypothetical protein